MIVIATDKMYVVAKKIYSIYLDEDIDLRYYGRSRLTFFCYNIKITFEPDDAGNQTTITPSRSNDIMTVEFKVHGHSRAINVYKDIVNQIREQCPDQVYLDKIAESFLTRREEDDPSTTEICESGKEERRSKTLLRRTKVRPGRRGKRNRR